MKSTNITLLFILVSLLTTAQNDPFKMSYQAIVRNSENQLVQNTQVGVRISILANGPEGDTSYAETHTATTNVNGLLDLQIGGGTQVFGSYAYRYIPWGDVNFYLKTEIDLNGGTNYTISSTSKMLSVPHSNYSHWSGALVGWASYYIGAYQLLEYSEFYLSISYLSTNKVLIIFDDDEKRNLIGNATPDMISIPSQEVDDGFLTGTAILSGDILTLTYTVTGDVGSETETFLFQRIQ